MNSLKRNIFIWLSGADSEALQHASDAEQRKFIKLGLSILIPAILGWAGMWFAGPYLGLIGIARVIIPSIWSIIIIVIDTYLVSSLNKKPGNRNVLGYYSLASFRILLAVFIGLAISHPLVLRILQNSIDEEILKMKREEISAVMAENRDTSLSLTLPLSDQISRIDSIIDCKERLLKAEGNGLKWVLPCGSSSGDKNRGFRYDRLVGEISELKTLRSTYRDSIQQIQTSYSDLTNADTVSINRNYSADYLKRMQALDRIESEPVYSKPTKWLVRVLLILFILLDSIAVISKVITPSGEYEEIYEITSSHKVAVAKFKYKNMTDLTEEVLKSDQEFRNRIINEIYRNTSSYTPQQIWKAVRAILHDVSNEHNPNDSDSALKKVNFKPLRLMVFLILSTLCGCLLWYVLKFTWFKDSDHEIEIAMGLYSTIVTVWAASLLK